MSDGMGIGLVGLGMAGRTHAREIAHLEGAHAAAAFGRSEPKVKAFADQFGIPRAYTDYDAFLADPDVAVVDVLTPHGLHRDYAVPAAEAGKHVVVEKPIALDLEQGQEIIDACERNGVTLGVMYQMRFGVWARKLKEAVDSGALGNLILVDGIEKAFRDPEYYSQDPWRGTREMEGAGCLMTQSIHIIDLLQWLAGPVKSVSGFVQTARHDIEAPDLAVARLIYENGAPGVLHSSTAITPAMRTRVEVHGHNGSVVINPEYDHLYFWDVEGTQEGPVEPGMEFPFVDTPDPNEFPEERHRLALTDILEAIRDGREPQVPGSEALKSLAIVLAIEESARTGCDAEVAKP